MVKVCFITPWERDDEQAGCNETYLYRDETSLRKEAVYEAIVVLAILYVAPDADTAIAEKEMQKAR